MNRYIFVETMAINVHWNKLVLLKRRKLSPTKKDDFTVINLNLCFCPCLLCLNKTMM